MTKTIVLNGKILPLKNKANLLDAIYWIAKRIYPVHEDYYSFTKNARENAQNQKEEATNELLYKLMCGEIIATGCPCQILDEYGLGPRIDSVEPETKIPSTAWKPDLISWERSELESMHSSNGFCNISIEMDALKKIFPLIPTAVSSAGNLYRSPYMVFMEKAIQELKIDDKCDIKKEIIEEWLIKNRPDELKLEATAIRYMATFLRTPRHTIGGLKPKNKGSNP